MYDLLRRGEFGNTFREWPSVFDAINDGYNLGPYGMRTLIKSDVKYRGDMTLQEVIRAEDEARSKGIRISVCEYVPNDRILMNAEVTRTPHGILLKYKHGPGYMKDAMKSPTYAQGVVANMVLQRSPCSAELYEHLQQLMDNYEGPIAGFGSAIVEFAMFDHCLGKLNKDYIIWEVRSY